MISERVVRKETCITTEAYYQFRKPLVGSIATHSIIGSPNLERKDFYWSTTGISESGYCVVRILFLKYPLTCCRRILHSTRLIPMTLALS
jgi:hypothetical protein